MNCLILLLLLGCWGNNGCGEKHGSERDNGCEGRSDRRNTGVQGGRDNQRNNRGNNRDDCGCSRDSGEGNESSNSRRGRDNENDSCGCGGEQDNRWTPNY